MRRVFRVQGSGFRVEGGGWRVEGSLTRPAPAASLRTPAPSSRCAGPKPVGYRQSERGSPTKFATKLATKLPQPSAIRHQPSAISGLTLVEVLFVMVILAILVGLVIGLGRYSDSAARIHQARADLGEWSSALGRWHDASDEYPASADGTVLGLVSNTLAITRFYTDEPDNELDMAAFFRDIALKDPWQQYYFYQGESNTLSGVVFRYDLFSAGPDGKTETSHDNVYFSN